MSLSSSSLKHDHSPYCSTSPLIELKAERKPPRPFSASEQNTQAALHHSPIPPTTSSSGRPRIHFASSSSLCAPAPSRRRASSSAEGPCTRTARVKPLPQRPLAL